MYIFFIFFFYFLCELYFFIFCLVLSLAYIWHYKGKKWTLYIWYIKIVPWLCIGWYLPKRLLYYSYFQVFSSWKINISWCLVYSLLQPLKNQNLIIFFCFRKYVLFVCENKTSISPQFYLYQIFDLIIPNNVTLALKETQFALRQIGRGFDFIL